MGATDPGGTVFVYVELMALYVELISGNGGGGQSQNQRNSFVYSLIIHKDKCSS